MRNPFKRQPRPAGKPSLRERAATLKSGLSRLLTRPEGHGEANQHRRALVAGSVAAAIPLPALARAAAPAALTPTGAPASALLLPVSHPDRALLDIAAAYAEAREAEAIASAAASAAGELVDAVAGRRPLALVPSRQDWDITYGQFRGRGRIPGQPFRYIFTAAGPLPEEHQRWQHAWTGAGLRSAIAKAVPMLGRGGQTPHIIRRWRALMPVADAFDAEVAAAIALTDYTRLNTEYRDATDKVGALHSAALRTVATTPEGLAAQVRLLAEGQWMKQGGVFTILMQSAAAVSGVTLPESDFDVRAWVAGWKSCGGRIEWIPRRHHQDELAFVSPDLSNRSPAAKAEVRRLECERGENSTLIARWLEANR